MATDLLRATANERVDLVDFEFLADSGLQANLRHLNGNFLTDPNGQRSWILDGFDISNPAGKQVQVSKGRAILGQREGALIFYGALAVEGDATKIIDMSTLTPNANYGVYIRFEYVDGDTGSRIFWNPAGTGSELAQTVATRRKANWSMRIELTNPGGEWVKIATADNTGGSAVITDERPLYFEGDPNDSYASGWSSDGSGGANDRNADRQQYGVKDLQTFTAAMRQSLEDIKGRGLRRWWDRDIGGMNIGFDDAPVEDRLAVGDVDFNLFNDGTDSMVVFDATDDRLFYDRSANQYLHQIGGTTEMLLGTDGLRIANGLYVGATGTAPTDDEVRMDGDLHVGGRTIYFGVGSNDYLEHDEAGNDFAFWNDGVEEYTFGSSALDLHSNDIDNATNIDGSGDLTMGTITMTGFSVDADGDTDVKTLDVTSGPSLTSSGISTAKAISGATSIDGTGDLTMGTITMTGFSVDADGDTVVKTLNAGTGEITGGFLDISGSTASDLERTTGTTNAFVDALTIRSKCTGDMTTGFGTMFRMQYADGGATHTGLELGSGRDTADDREYTVLRVKDTGTASSMITLLYSYQNIVTIGREIDESLNWNIGNGLVIFNKGNSYTQTQLDNAYDAGITMLDTYGGIGQGLSVNMGGDGGLYMKGGSGSFVALVQGDVGDDGLVFNHGGYNGSTYAQGGYDPDIVSGGNWWFGNGFHPGSPVAGNGGTVIRTFGAGGIALVVYRSSTTAADQAFSVYSYVGSAVNQVLYVQCDGTVRNDTGTYTTISDERAKDFMADFYSEESPLLPYDIGRVFSTVKPIVYGLKKHKHTQAELLGFRAKQVQKVVPPLVMEGEDGLLSVNLTGMVPVMWEAIRQIMERLDMLGEPV